jgi:hypothetical protein
MDGSCLGIPAPSGPVNIRGVKVASSTCEEELGIDDSSPCCYLACGGNGTWRTHGSAKTSMLYILFVQSLDFFLPTLHLRLLTYLLRIDEKLRQTISFQSITIVQDGR